MLNEVISGSSMDTERAYSGWGGGSLVLAEPPDRDETGERAADRRSGGRLREAAMLLAAAEDAICIADVAGRILFWSPGCERLYGWGSDEAVGQSVVDVMFGGTSYGWARLKGFVMEKGRWEGDLETFSRKKEALSVRARAWVMREEEGGAASIVIVATDLTGKRQLEKQLLRAQRLESVGTLACGIAHDLANVLTPVQMAAELLRPTVAGTDGERFLNLLVRSAARGVALTRQLLLFGRGDESGHAAVDLRSLLKETVKMLKGTLPKSIQVHGVIPDDLSPVIGDATQIHQVLLNLCVNARDAMPDGGVLTVLTRNQALDDGAARVIKGGRPGRFVTMTVRDTGHGISREVLARMFDPFFTTKPPAIGSGLGLSTVQRILGSHRGFVSVKTEEGGGSEFTVYLPVATTEPPATAADVTLPARAGQSEWVLVLENEDTIRELAQAGLERAGYRVVSAADGGEGISIFGRRHTEIGVVVLDMMLPWIDGATAIRMFRKLQPDVEIVVMCGMPSLRTLAFEAAQQRLTYLEKPIRGDELLAAVGAAMDRKAARCHGGA